MCSLIKLSSDNANVTEEDLKDAVDVVNIIDREHELGSYQEKVIRLMAAYYAKIRCMPEPKNPRIIEDAFRAHDEELRKMLPKNLIHIFGDY